MANLFDTSNVNTADGGAHAIFLLKELLKSAGWDVPASGTGVAGSYAASDLITTATILNASRAWFRIRAPASMSPRREFCFQRGSTSQATWWIKVSAEDGFVTGGDTDDMATAADEFNLHGSGTAGTSLFGTAESYRVSCMAQDASPFAWYLFTCTNGSGAVVTALMFEPLTAGSVNALDQDPALYYATASQAFQLAHIAASGTGPFGWYRKDLSSEATARFPAQQYADSGGSTAIPALVGTNSYDDDDNHYPMPYARRSALGTQVGFKGVGTICRWLGTTRADMDTLTQTTTRDLVSVGDCVLPWDGTVPSF